MDTDQKIGKWESQVRKGVLDFVILICVEHAECYGYELMRKIKETDRIGVSEGTIYPLLNRLAKEELIISDWVEMETGIPRKYYRITPKGRQALAGMKQAWGQFTRSIDQLLEQR